MKTIMYTAIGALLVCVLLLACTKFPDYPIDDLLNAPETIEIDGREFVMETAIFRSFMPSCPPDGHPMVAIIWVVAVDSQQFASSVDFDYLWVINEEHDIWLTDFEEDATRIEDYKLKKVARDGPKWDVEPYPVLVDVVVRVKDGAGNDYLLRAANQIIQSPIKTPDCFSIFWLFSSSERCLQFLSRRRRCLRALIPPGSR
jgi:hypothetical protein